jgi:hypothetical protein
MVTVMSLPMTSKAIWLTTSGITGLTLPGMIDEPAGARRQIDLTQARLRPRRQQAQVVAGLGQLAGHALQHAGELHERAVSWVASIRSGALQQRQAAGLGSGARQARAA